MKTIRIHKTSTRIEVGKILCLGRNYSEHAKEMGTDIPENPIIFLKPSSSIIYDGERIIKPAISENLHYEVELIIAIAKEGKDIPISSSNEYILGYGVGLDMTLRDLQNEAKKKGLPWSVAKGFDTSAPISDIIPAHMIKDPRELEIRCLVNNIERQRTSISKMIFSCEQIISYCSKIFTLERGDLIFTGTPEGVGEVKHGDRIESELVGYIKISNEVISSKC